MPTATLTDLERALRSLESQLRLSRVEIAVVIDPVAIREVARVTGTWRGVSLMGLDLRDKVVTHNHPRPGVPFPSFDDVNAGAANNALQVRVAGWWMNKPWLTTITRDAKFKAWPAVLPAFDAFHVELVKSYIARYGVNPAWKKLLPMLGGSFPEWLTYWGGYV